MKALLLLAPFLIAQNARPEFASINGLVRTADGSAAAGVRIAAMAVEPDGTVSPASATLASLSQTDAEGRYQLENVPPGRYFITAGFVDSPSYYPGVSTPQEARALRSLPARESRASTSLLPYPAGSGFAGGWPTFPKGCRQVSW